MPANHPNNCARFATWTKQILLKVACSRGMSRVEMVDYANSNWTLTTQFMIRGNCFIETILIRFWLDFDRCSAMKWKTRKRREVLDYVDFRKDDLSTRDGRSKMQLGFRFCGSINYEREFSCRKETKRYQKKW